MPPSERRRDVTLASIATLCNSGLVPPGAFSGLQTVICGPALADGEETRREAGRSSPSRAPSEITVMRALRKRVAFLSVDREMRCARKRACSRVRSEASGGR